MLSCGRALSSRRVECAIRRNWYLHESDRLSIEKQLRLDLASSPLGPVQPAAFTRAFAATKRQEDSRNSSGQAHEDTLLAAVLAMEKEERSMQQDPAFRLKFLTDVARMAPQVQAAFLFRLFLS